MFSKVRSWTLRFPLGAFLMIAFGYTWICLILLAILAPDNSRSQFFYIPTVYGPTIAGLAIPLIAGGPRKLQEFLKRRLSWKLSPIWYLVSLLVIPILLLILRGLHPLIFPGISLPALVIERPWSSILVGFLMMLPYGPLAEELGWRGFALPLLQERMNALNASIVLGMIWWAWHLPQLLIPELQWAVGGLPVFLYLLLILPGSILAAWIFNRSNGSVLPAILLHASMNYFTGLLGFNSPYFFSMVVSSLWVVSLLIIICSGLKARQSGKPLIPFKLGKEISG